MACAYAQEDEFEVQSSSAVGDVDSTPVDDRGPGYVDPRTGKPYVMEGEDEWQAQKRRLAEGSGGSRGRSSHYSPKKRRKKKSWLSLLGVGGDDKDGKPKP